MQYWNRFKLSLTNRPRPVSLNFVSTFEKGVSLYLSLDNIPLKRTYNLFQMVHKLIEMVFDTIKKQFVWLINALGCYETFRDKYLSSPRCKNILFMCSLLNSLGREFQ